MPSKTSSIKKQIILYDLKKVGWLSVLYFLALFLIVPLQLIIQYTNPKARQFMEKGSLFLYTPEFQWILSITVPVLMGVLLFRYLHSKQDSDFIHSLPVRRSALYHQHLAAGAVLIIVPVAINALILLGLNSLTGIGGYFTITHLLSWIGIMLFLSLFMFLATVFTAMITGMLSMHLVLTYIFVLLPAGFMLLLIFNISTILAGFPVEYYLDISLAKYSPISYFWFFRGDMKLSWIVLTVYIAVGILLYIAANWLYIHRSLEATSQAVVYSFMRPLFRYGVMFCSMMAGGLFFYTMSFSFGWVVIGYIGGSLAGFVIAESILRKTWKVFNNLKAYLFFVAFLVIVFGTMYFVKGTYVNNIPNVSEVERVYFGDSYGYEDSDWFTLGTEPLYFTDKHDIALVQQIQKRIIDLGDVQYESQLEDTYPLFIAYELENGDKVTRYYTYSLEDPEILRLQKEIESSANYKHANSPVFNLKPEEVYKIDVESNAIKKSSSSVTDRETILTLIDAIKKDIEASEPRVNTEAVPLYKLELFTSEYDDYLLAEFDDTYKNTINVLKEIGIYEDLELIPEDVNNIQLESYFLDQEVIIDDKDEIQHILDHLVYYSHKDNAFYVTAQLNKGQNLNDQLSIEYDDLPQSIKNQLEE
jgi:ABC-2 type transport system permease protein